MKVLRYIFYTLIGILYLLMFLNGFYLALPVEVQARFGFMSRLIAVIGGASFGSIATGLLWLDRRLANKEASQEMQHSELIKAFVDYVGKNKDENKVIIEGQRYLTNAVERNNRLLEADLNAKLNNELISEKTKEIIEGVLNEK